MTTSKISKMEIIKTNRLISLNGIGKSYKKYRGKLNVKRDICQEQKKYYDEKWVLQDTLTLEREPQ